MALVKAWIQAELESILQIGLQGAPARSRFRRQSKKQHVQCVEVDEAHNALKINDGNTLIWCFISRPVMGDAKAGTEAKSSLSGLENKTIKIEDWEFSTLSTLCPTFDERKAKGNGQICLLINKLVPFTGERTTTIGKPSHLCEGNRDLRAVLRTVSRPRDLIKALAKGQGLPDLRDINGVLMSAPESPASGLAWTSVDSPPLVGSSAERAAEMHPGFATDRGGGEGSVSTACAPMQVVQGERAAGKEPTPNTDPRGESPTCEREPCSQAMSQFTLGMDYDEELEDDADDYRTQAQSAGNIFSQEPMEMRPASPTPSPPAPENDGSGLRTSNEKDPETLLNALSSVASANDGGEDEICEAHDTEDHAGTFDVPAPGAPPSGNDSASNGALPSGNDSASNGARRRSSSVDDDARGEEQPGENDNDDPPDGEEDDSPESMVPAGFTQLDVVAEEISNAQPPAQEASGNSNQDNDEDQGDHEREAEEEENEEDDPEHAPMPYAGKGKGKRRARNVRRGGVGNSQGARRRKVRGQAKNQPPAGTDAAAPSEDPYFPPESSSLQELSAGTTSSSIVPSPSTNNLQMSCLTQKRQNEGVGEPNSGARAASRKCNIRTRFDHSAAGRRDSPGFSTGAEDGVSSDRLDNAAQSPTPGHRSSDNRRRDELDAGLFERAAEFFPRKALMCGSIHSRQNGKPLSDVLVTVDPSWSGRGCPKIAARGYEVDPLLAEWLDDDPRGFDSPLMSIEAWLDGGEQQAKRRRSLSSRASRGHGRRPNVHWT